MRGFQSTGSQRMGVPEVSESEGEGESAAEQRSPPSERVVKLVDEIAQLTLLEVADLTALLKKKLGLPDMPMGGMSMMAMPGVVPGAPPAGAAGGAAPEPVAEKTSFDVKLEKFDAAAKLKIIKEVRALTGLGLKESKDLVESAPAVVKKGVAKDEAESIVEKLKALGAEVNLE